MSYFFTTLSKGMGQPEALRAAKLKLMWETQRLRGGSTFWESLLSKRTASSPARARPLYFFVPAMSLRPLSRTGLTLTLAGLALTSIISPGLKGLGFLPALVAGFLT